MTGTSETATFRKAKATLRRRADAVVETHCAIVFLTGDRALKIKKPVDLGYLDFSTLEKRRDAIARELRLNRTAAPDIYRETTQVDGEPVLVMRRFPESAVLANDPGRIDGRLAEALGRTVARSHAGAERRPKGGGRATLAYVAESNAELIAALGLDREKSAAIETRTLDALERCGALLDLRRARGLARRCHGDLHLGNIVVEGDEPVLFDCIEFSDVLSDIDVLYDLAFLLMDLVFRGRSDAANRVMNAWADESARLDGDDVWTGLAVLPLLLSIRAAVRCHVSGQTGDLGLAGRYLDAALSHLEPASPSLTAIGGLSGTGKSRRARLKAPSLGAAPGAVVLRTDEIRKRLWGAGALDRLPKEAYAPEFGERVYGEMFRVARLCLAAGRAAVLDAVFLRPAERDAAERLAAEFGVPFEGRWLTASPDTLRRRVAGRRGDASDADLDVLERQLQIDPGPLRWRTVPTD